MSRRRTRLPEIHDWFRSVTGPVLLGVIVVLLSSLGFAYVHRNDMLIFSSLSRNPRGVAIFTAVGAHAAAGTPIFPEPAMIEYLHSLQEATALPEGKSIIKRLLQAGASLTERNAAGWTPLMLAASAGYLPVVEELIERGADIDARAIGGETTEGMTALMAASMHGNTSVVEYLAAHGANVHLRARAGYTALLLASSRGHAATVEILLKKGAAIPLSTIQVAERNGHKEIAQRLRDARPVALPETSPRHPAQHPEE